MVLKPLLGLILSILLLLMELSRPVKAVMYQCNVGEAVEVVVMPLWLEAVVEEAELMPQLLM